MSDISDLVKKGNKEYTVLASKKNISIDAGQFSKYSSVYFLNETSIDGFSYQKQGKNLIIVNNDQTIELKNYFSKGYSTKSNITKIKYNQIGSIVEKSIINDGVINSDLFFTANANSKRRVTGTVFSDTIKMSEYNNDKEKGLTINAGKGNDTITGSQYGDTITGGAGINTINFDFSKTFGKDTIKLTKNEVIVLNITDGDESLSFDDLNFNKSGNNLSFTYGDNTVNEIIIKDYFKVNKTTSSVSIYLDDTTLSDYMTTADITFDITGKGKIYGTNFKDKITGSEGNDTIYGYAGDDTILTKGGKDTVVLTGEYGHDTIDSTGSSKVTVKLSSFDSANMSLKGNDFVYTTDENSDFTYKNFLTDNSADLWVSANKKNYFITNETDENVDYSKKTSNNVVFLNGNTPQTYNSSKKGSNIVYSYDNSVTFNYAGGKDSYISDGSSDDVYNGKLTKNTHLVISDEGGDNDILNLSNNPKDLVLFYNIDQEGNTGDDLIIYNKQAMTASGLTKSLKNDSYSGIKIENYFKEGEIENINYLYNNETVEMDISKWKYMIDTYVKDWLIKNNKTSVEDVMLNGKDKEKSELVSIFKNNSYALYEAISSKSDKYYDISIVNNNNVLEIYGKNNRKLYSVANFISDDSNETISLFVLDDNDKLMSYIITAQLEVRYGLDNDNTLYINDEKKTILSVADGTSNTLIFENKEYSDFYTKPSEEVAYNAGDPLIRKDNKNLLIGDNLTVKRVNGLNAEIQLVDKNQDTKNIIIGTGTVNGTFESEIIVGSDKGDIINSMGGNDLIYAGSKDDVLNFTAGQKDTATGKNTADMIGIGGTVLSDDNPYAAVSVYNSNGDDTYNTSFDVGLYIEDSNGYNDVINITDTAENLLFFFDVAKQESDEDKLYTDLFICDKADFLALRQTLVAGADAMELMESMQGKLGYVWIDDFYGGDQLIEKVNYTNSNTGVTRELNKLNNYNNVHSELYEIAEGIQNWLATTNYSTAWEVLENNNPQDINQLLNLYTS